MNFFIACTQAALQLRRFSQSRPAYVSLILGVLVSAPCSVWGQPTEPQLKFADSKSAVVFSVISDRFHIESREFRFGTGPNTGFVRPFAFSADSQLFLYGLNEQCFVMDAKSGKTIWSTFNLKEKHFSTGEEPDASLDTKIQIAALDSESYRAFLACKNDRLFRVDFAELKNGKLEDTVEFLPKPKIKIVPKSIPNYLHVEMSGRVFIGSAYQPYHLGTHGSATRHSN